MVSVERSGIALQVATRLVWPLARGVAEVLGHPDVRPYARHVVSVSAWSSTIGPMRALIAGPGVVMPVGEDGEPMGLYGAFSLDSASLPGLASVLPPVDPPARCDPPPPWRRSPAPPVVDPAPPVVADPGPRHRRMGRHRWS